jgi:tetratricopeptide (TPR) repeat protein
MKNKILFITTLIALNALGQTSQEHFENGISKHNEQDFKGAIKEYDKAIKADKENKDAYFNRGSCELALKDFKSAMSDFSKTIELDPTYVKAYYSRATTFASQNKYREALPDLDKTIELDEKMSTALNLRGQIRAQAGDKRGACEDFNKSKDNGDEQASKYINQFCGNELQEGESLMLYWPEDESWKVGSNQEDGNMNMMELIHSDETLESWTEFGYMMSMKGVKNVPMDKAMEMMFEQSKKNSSKAKLTFIEKDENAEFPWTIFTIECPSFKNDKRPESQLWYIVQGKTSLYTNFRAVKEAKIPDELKEKWTKFFKTGKIIYK